MLLVVDHHDSFTWNLVHTLGRFAGDVHVAQSETLSVASVRAMRPRGIVLSPGPGHPLEAVRSIELVQAFASCVPILGVCLGHQLMCAAFSAEVVHAPQVVHGRTSLIRHADTGLFAGLPSAFAVARYHSLLVDARTLPAALSPTAWTESGELMAVEHVSLPLHGVQFHPESFLTEHGPRLIRSFVACLAGGARDFDENLAPP